MVQKISTYPISLFGTPKDGSVMQQLPLMKGNSPQHININGEVNANNSVNYSPERFSS